MNLKKIGLIFLCLLSVEARSMDWGRFTAQVAGVAAAYLAVRAFTGSKPITQVAQMSMEEKQIAEEARQQQLVNQASTSTHCYHVLSQSGVSCGYHALKNGLLITDMLQGKNSILPGCMTLEEALLDYDVYHKCYTPWKEQAANLNDAEPLEVFTLFTLAEPYKNENTTITCVNNNFTPVLSDEGDAFFVNLKANINPEYGLKNHTYIFLLNTGDGASANQNAHWIVIVLHVDANGELSYYGADSLNNNERIQRYIRKLKIEMEKEIVSNCEALNHMIQSFRGNSISQNIMDSLPNMAKEPIDEHQRQPSLSRISLVKSMEKILHFSLSDDERKEYASDVEKCRLVCDLERSITVLSEWKNGTRSALTENDFPQQFVCFLLGIQKDTLDDTIEWLRDQCPKDYHLNIIH